MLDQLPFQSFDCQNVLWKKRMMVLARRFGLSAYDAAYLELADRLQCALLTNDREVQVAAEALGIPLS
jgi:predicted nucleic acid-binding protein